MGYKRLHHIIKSRMLRNINIKLYFLNHGKIIHHSIFRGTVKRVAYHHKKMTHLLQFKATPEFSQLHVLPAAEALTKPDERGD